MEVIHLESSDDEGVAAAPLFVKSPTVHLDDDDDNDDDDDDDSSTSSDDSIWNEKGLSTSLKRKCTGTDPLIGRPADRGGVNKAKMPPQNALRINLQPEIPDTIAQNTVYKARASYTFSVEIDDNDEEPLPPEVPLNKDGTWKIVLLMDHREFGCRKDNFLLTVEKNVNSHFQGKFAEITTLPSADFLFVARLISKTTGEIMDERVLDLVIERKNVEDLSHCLIQDSKKYKPLSFFEAQMYKLRRCGIRKKVFLMEDDEDRAACFFVGVKTPVERDKCLKRVKTIR
jgi:hypothetical protein